MLWEKGRRAASTPVGVLLLLAKGFDNDTARWINQNPIGSQGNANEWQVYRVRLTDPRMLVGNRFNGHAVERQRGGPQRLARQRARSAARCRWTGCA